MNGIFAYLFHIEKFILFIFQFFNNVPTTKCHYYFLIFYILHYILQYITYFLIFTYIY